MKSIRKALAYLLATTVLLFTLTLPVMANDDAVPPPATTSEGPVIPVGPADYMLPPPIITK